MYIYAYMFSVFPLALAVLSCLGEWILREYCVL